MGDYMIEIKNVSKNIIQDLDLTIKDGEIFAFLGPNGAGKTTTIKMITGILPIARGDILIDGNSIITNPIQAKKKMGLVPDSPDVFLRLKGIEYLNFIGDMYKVPIDIRNKRIEEYTKELEVNDILNDKIETYSHGTRQKFVIIGVLLHVRPQISFLFKRKDERTCKKRKYCIFFYPYIRSS